MKPNELIQKLRRRRRELEITQKELARKVGVSVGVSDSYFSLMERGKRTCSLVNFAKACEALNLEVVIKNLDQAREKCQTKK